MNKSYDIAETEAGWYQKWMEAELFIANPDINAPAFSMVLPPPNITGSLHMGHALTFTIPDIIARRKKMEGYNTLWLPGVDHAGIATQMIVERNLLKEKNVIKEDLGRDKFLEEIWNWKEKYEARIIEQIERLGLTLDWSRKKFTLDPKMAEVVTHVFVELYKEDKIYKGTYMVNYCPSCKTVLSDLEVNHKEVNGKLTYLKYPLKGTNDQFVIVATTRPETMLGDTAVAVNPSDKRYKEMIGKTLLLPLTDRYIDIVGDSEVSTEFGTGAVKVTPGHDPLDYEIGQRHKLKKMVIIDKEGKMTGEIPKRFIGLSREECRKRVVRELEEKGLIEKIENYDHNVGHCQRCEAVVEPQISEQWFLKTKELSKPAMEKVRNGEIEFIPKKWEKIYFNWMENIRDWCISRQLWWGHRIPAYYCNRCDELMVEETNPGVCKKCGSDDIRQDPDVLDTWFSSALWPFSTLGWKDKDPDFTTFYPTTLMATAFDIIFFWVARMIMMGIHFGKDIPFRKVLINGLIRDEHGVKMSKTKNNVIDPIDIIDEYGTDALRFTLAIQAVPGMDISLSTNRIRGYKAFANKIWNASRFIIMNLKKDDDIYFDNEKITVTDKWILHSLNLLVKKINDLSDDYRINEAADVLYHFFWHEYCDWYLEFSKNDIDKSDTRKVLKFSLLTLLKILHPFMPYITDEIYSKIRVGNNEFLLQTKYPSFTSDLVFTKEFNDIELLKRLISETRKTRTENRIDPNKKMKIYLKSSEENEIKPVRNGIKYFDFLTKGSGTEIVKEFSTGAKGFRGVVNRWEILLPFESEEDRVKELERLRSELGKTEKMIGSVEHKLSNENFIKRAPGNIISGFKETLQNSIDKREKLEKTIEDLS